MDKLKINLLKDKKNSIMFLRKEEKSKRSKNSKSLQLLALKDQPIEVKALPKLSFWKFIIKNKLLKEICQLLKN
jgi:hypothetical protein